MDEFQPRPPRMKGGPLAGGQSGLVRILAVTTAVLVLLSLPALGREARRDPQTGVVRVLYIGAPFMWGPFQFLQVDPLIQVTPVDGNAYGIPPALVSRALRLYIPRSLEQLASSYDVVGLDDATCANFETRTLSWFGGGVTEKGMGLFMGGGFEAFGGMAGFPSWGATPVGEVLPVDPTGEYPNGIRIKITNPNDPLIASLPFDTFGDKYNFFDANGCTSKDGSHVIAKIIGKDMVAWAWWDVGKGRSFASCTALRGGGVGPFSKWPHYGDFVSNMVYFLAGIGLPEDIELVHVARERMKVCMDESSYVISITDFVEKFGANPTGALKKLAEAEEKRKLAILLYRQLKTEEAVTQLDDAIDTYDQAYELAMDARNRAMFWIFLIQWMAVTATGLVCGFLLWTIMVRRKLYHEVQVTRLR